LYSLNSVVRVVNKTYDAETRPRRQSLETEKRPRHWSDGIETRPRRLKKTPRDSLETEKFETETTTLSVVFVSY